MEISRNNYNQCCRICISAWDNLHDLFTTYIGVKQLSFMLSKCIDGMIVGIDDGLPSSICSECRANLEIAYNFQDLCRTNEAKLRNIGQIADNELFVETKLFIKAELPDFIENEIFADNLSMGDDENIDNIDNDDNVIDSVATAANKCSINSNPRRTIHSRKYPCLTCDKIFTNKSNLNRHIKSKTLANEQQAAEPRKEDSFHCLECGEKFASQTYLLLHLQSHEVFINEPRIFACELCSKLFEKTCNLGKHMQSHLNARRFTCRVCNRIYTGINLINLHLNKHERDRKAIQHNTRLNNLIKECDGIDEAAKTDANGDTQTKLKSIDDETAAQQLTHKSIDCHDENSTNTNPFEAKPKSKYQIVTEGDRTWYQCPTCPNRYANSSNLNRHIKDKSIFKWYQKEQTSELNNPLYKCFKCSGRFDGQELLIKHLKMCTATDYIEDKIHIECDHCPKFFAKASFLCKHIRIHQHVVQIYYCSLCSCEFNSISLLSHHLYSAHREEVFVCQVCCKEFGDVKHLKIHSKTHAELATSENASATSPDSSAKKHLCPVCGKDFNNTSNFNRHKLLHTNNKPYKCTKCPSRFVTSSSLKRHMLYHTEARPFKCNLCELSYKLLSTLADHKRIKHYGQRNYTCDICNRSFGRLSNFRIHKLRHIGDKPHKCNHCTQAFNQKPDLVKHLQIHVGKNTYQCSDCPERFYYAKELREHRMIHIQIDNEAPLIAEEN